MLWQQQKLCDTKNKRLMLTKMFRVAQKRNTFLQKVVLVAYKYMSN